MAARISGCSKTGNSRKVTPAMISDQVRMRISPWCFAKRGIHSRTTNAAAACMPMMMPMTDALRPIERPWIGM